MLFSLIIVSKFYSDIYKKSSDYSKINGKKNNY